jgi:bromodomain-containing protein 8
MMAGLNKTESLIFSQVIYEFGTNDWSDVVKVLQKHPLIHRPKSFFTVQVVLPTIYFQ